MAAALVPAIAAGASAAPTPYADQVGIGTAVKIANPELAAVQADASDTQAATDQATDEATDEATDQATDAATGDPSSEPTSTETPSGAVVIETESHQAADATDTSVAVLGTKIGSSADELASTGPSRVTAEILLAMFLVGAGVLLRSTPRLWDGAQAARTRRH